MKKAFIILGSFIVIGIAWIYFKPHIHYEEFKSNSHCSVKRERDSLAAINAKQEKLNYEYKQLLSKVRELNLELHGIKDKEKLIANLLGQIKKQEQMIANREEFLASKSKEDYTLDTREKLVMRIQEHKDMIKTLNGLIEESLKIPNN